MKVFSLRFGRRPIDCMDWMEIMTWRGWAGLEEGTQGRDMTRLTGEGHLTF